MSSFIYFYSKFTEDFLLLGAAAIFTLLSIYCYHWVVRRRMLGAARNQIPAGMVRVYLNQLINEAQSVRTQLFGLVAGAPSNDASLKFQMQPMSTPTSTGTPHSEGHQPAGTEVPKDLLERLNALETQLSQKESMVVNVNIEKMKLLEEVENLKQNQKVLQNPTSGGDQPDLLKKIRSLEERLDEYALFEDDLANLKRLQQENIQLKKRLNEGGAAAPTADTPPVTEPKTETPKAEKSLSLDPDAIDQLLNGVTPEAKASSEMAAKAIETIEKTMEAEPVIAAVPAIETPPAPAGDEFERLVDSVETSLEPAAAPIAVEAKKEESLASKTDEELLKEFENLLNS